MTGMDVAAEMSEEVTTLLALEVSFPFVLAAILIVVVVMVERKHNRKQCQSTCK